MATYQACPTEIVEAPFEIVWKLLTDFSGWSNFYDVRVVRVEPPGPAVIGQRMVGETGPRWLHLRISLEFTVIDKSNHKLGIKIKLPLGIDVVEDLDCLPIDEQRCRVNYHCNFTFANNWRGSLLRFLLGRELQNGPIDSIRRLKRAAEQEFLRTPGP